MNLRSFSGAAERNRKPILEQLHALLPTTGTVLEIGSGSGQHAMFFSANLPHLQWQPSETGSQLEVLVANTKSTHAPRVLEPLKLDVLSDPWPTHAYAAAYSANTAHIMSWDTVIAMFAGVSGQLDVGTRFFLYGPFNIDHCFTSPGNAQFDAHLREEDSRMGIRDMQDIELLANKYQMQLERKLAMPANNFILVFLKVHRAC